MAQLHRNTSDSRQNKIRRFNKSGEEREIRLRTKNAIISVASPRQTSFEHFDRLADNRVRIYQARQRGNSAERSQRNNEQRECIDLVCCNSTLA